MNAIQVKCSVAGRGTVQARGRRAPSQCYEQVGKGVVKSGQGDRMVLNKEDRLYGRPGRLVGTHN